MREMIEFLLRLWVHLNCLEAVLKKNLDAKMFQDEAIFSII